MRYFQRYYFKCMYIYIFPFPEIPPKNPEKLLVFDIRNIFISDN